MSIDLAPLKKIEAPVAIVGLGATGQSLYALLIHAGLSKKDLITFDDIALSADYTSAEKMFAEKNVKTLLVSPGYPLKTPWIQLAAKSGVQITNEMELCFSCLKNEKIICVTGSIGKSTTTALLAFTLSSFTKSFFAGGNLGAPLSQYLLKGQPCDWLVLELSSYHLEKFENLRCDFSAITFLTPNHLERYSSKEEYYDTKLKLIASTKNTVLLNARGGDLKKYLLDRKGERLLWVDSNSEYIKKYSLEKPKLLGDYNLDNLSLAAAVAEAAGWPTEAIQKMRDFPGLPHRLENLGEHKGITFINDSKATTMQSVIDAVKTVAKSIPANGFLWVLLGGHDKNLPWEQLKTLSVLPVFRPIFFGEFGAQAKTRTGFSGDVYSSLREAIQGLRLCCKKNDIVLLSPGGTSHDEFKNFEERGDFFKNEILKL